MPGKQVTVVVRIKAKSGMEQQVRRELFNLLYPTREEPGCLNFDMHEDPQDPHSFSFTRTGCARTTLSATSKRSIFGAGSQRPTRCWLNRWS